jgi:hypothetical protein
LRKVELLLAILAVCTVTAVAEDTLPGYIESFEHPLLGASAKVDNVTFNASKMTIHLISGSAAPVTIAGRLTGLFFVGKGSFDYISTDPTEAPIATFEAHKASAVKAERKDATVTFHDDFEELLLLAGGAPLPELPTAQGVPLDRPFAAHQELFSRVRTEPPSHLFAQWTFDAPSATLVRAEISGGKDPYWGTGLPKM